MTNLKAKLAEMATDTSILAQNGSAGATGSLMAFIGKQAVNAPAEIMAPGMKYGDMAPA